MNRFAHVLVALCFAAGLTACGGGYSGFILPVESELNPWVAPETDEFIDDGADDSADDEGDYEDYEDEEEAAPAPAAAPAAK